MFESSFSSQQLSVLRLSVTLQLLRYLNSLLRFPRHRHPGDTDKTTDVCVALQHRRCALTSPLGLPFALAFRLSSICQIGEVAFLTAGFILHALSVFVKGSAKIFFICFESALPARHEGQHQLATARISFGAAVIIQCLERLSRALFDQFPDACAGCSLQV
jgi:hypothetical protein